MCVYVYAFIHIHIYICFFLHTYINVCGYKCVYMCFSGESPLSPIYCL